MTDKKDGSGQKDAAAKGSDKPASEASAKRPFATIDLKAVEVAADTARASAQGGKPFETSTPKAPEAATPRTQAGAAERVAAAQASVSAKASTAPSGASAPPTGGAGGRKPNESTSPAASTAAAPSAPSPRTSGFGRVLTHTMAGLLGGVLAIAAAPQLTPVLKDMGLPVPPPAVPPELAQRLATLERAATAPVDPARDPARAISEAQAARRQIDELQTRLTGLAGTQEQTAKLSAELAQRITREPPIADAAERIVTIEKQLATLGELARAEPDRAGRIPQLAQLVGRISDLEAQAAARIADLRKELLREVDTRLQPSNEASESARVTSQRVDRDVGALKSEANRIAAGLDQVKTVTERQQLALKSVQDDTAQLGVSLDTVRRDLDARLKTLARPQDISAAVAPLAGQVSTLEQNLSTVVRSETERNATAERIVLSLELGNLKRAMERGSPFTTELAEVRRIAGNRLDLAPLDRYRDKGVATLATLGQEFRAVANAVLDADAEKGDGTVVDRLISGAKTFVRVRRTTAAAGEQTPEAIVARMETALKAGRLGDVLSEAKSLPQVPAIGKEWLAKVEARQTVDAALAAIDASLKAALGAGGAAPAAATGKRGPQ